MVFVLPGTIPADPHGVPPVDCLLVFSLLLCWPGVLLGGPGTSLCQGLVDVHTKCLTVLKFPRRQMTVLGSEHVRCLGTGPPRGAAEELLWGFGVPTPQPYCPGEVSAQCWAVSRVDLDGKEAVEMAAILTPSVFVPKPVIVPAWPKYRDIRDVTFGPP